MRFQRTPLSELEQPCGRCNHQNAVHTGGAKNWGWPIYDATWANTTGWCQMPGCDCAGRVRASSPTREAA